MVRACTHAYVRVRAHEAAAMHNKLGVLDWDKPNASLDSIRSTMLQILPISKKYTKLSHFTEDENDHIDGDDASDEDLEFIGV
jgi:hypothetical protein